jgi:hypothetical protein
MIREYRGRRCHIRRCNFPPFGFGLPLTPAHRTLSACLADHDDVNRIVTASNPHVSGEK